MKTVFLKFPCVYVLVFLVVAVLMTVYEAIKELIFKGSLTPWESHTITIFITSFLAVFAAMIIRNWSVSVHNKDQEIRLQQQKLTTLKLLMKAIYHILNNFLNHFQLVKLEVEDNSTVKKETLALLELSIEETIEQLRLLEEMREPEKKESYSDFYPK